MFLYIMQCISRLKFKIKWKFGGHIFGHIFWITLFSKQYFTMNAIHEIPETNGYDSQHLDLTSRFLRKYQFLTDLNSAEKTWRVFKAFTWSWKCLKNQSRFFGRVQSVKKLYFESFFLREHDQDVGYHTHSFQVSRGLHSLWNIFLKKV